MGISKELKLVETWFQRVWKQEESEAVDELFAGGKVRGLGAQTKMTPEAFKQFHSSMCALISDIDITIDKYIQEGQWLSVLCTIRAKSRSTGAGVTMTGNVWVRIADGQIQEAYNHFDFMGLWEQLGYLPVDCFEKGLQGKKIV